MKTKLFFDTEFTGLHQKTTLISIGIISECGKTFYAELNDYDQLQINEWLQKNIINNLKFSIPNENENEYYLMARRKDNPIGNPINNSYSLELRCSTEILKKELTDWLKQFDEVEMWSDCLAYDWVLFNEIFGHAFNIPKNIYYIPFDICTLFKIKNIDPDISREKYSGLINNIQKHNALWDAKIIKECYLKLIT